MHGAEGQFPYWLGLATKKAVGAENQEALDAVPSLPTWWQVERQRRSGIT